MVMAAENAPVPEAAGVCCYLAGMDEPSRAKAFLLAEELRRAGVSCECDLMGRSLKAQFKYAEKTGARYVAVIGERELNEGVAEVTDMKNSSSERIEFDKLAESCKK